MNPLLFEARCHRRTHASVRPNSPRPMNLTRLRSLHAGVRLGSIPGLGLGLALGLGASAAMSQTTAPADGVLAHVVVTASGFEQKVPEAPASISLVHHEDLAKRPYANLVDALRDVEGIDVGMEAPDKNGQAAGRLQRVPAL